MMRTKVDGALMVVVEVQDHHMCGWAVNCELTLLQRTTLGIIYCSGANYHRVCSSAGNTPAYPWPANHMENADVPKGLH